MTTIHQSPLKAEHDRQIVEAHAKVVGIGKCLCKVCAEARTNGR